jgi:hypothetical protein
MISSCEICHEPFEHRYPARYCGDRCRKAAQRARADVTAAEPFGAGLRPSKSPSGPSIPNITPKPPEGIVSSTPVTPVTLSNPAVGIVSDATYPNMWRVRFRDGQVSDMVNRIRAKDALRPLREDARSRGPPRS